MDLDVADVGLCALQLGVLQVLQCQPQLYLARRPVPDSEAVGGREDVLAGDQHAPTDGSATPTDQGHHPRQGALLSFLPTKYVQLQGGQSTNLRVKGDIRLGRC